MKYCSPARGTKKEKPHWRVSMAEIEEENQEEGVGDTELQIGYWVSSKKNINNNNNSSQKDTTKWRKGSVCQNTER